MKRDIPETIQALHAALKERYRDCHIRFLNGNYEGTKGTMLGNVLEKEGHKYRVGCRVTFGGLMAEVVLHPDSRKGLDINIVCASATGSEKFDIREPNSIENLLAFLDGLVAEMKTEAAINE